MKIITELIDYYGSQEKLAAAAGVAQGAVSQWKTGKTKMNAIQALKIEKATSGKFKAVDLCPKLREIE